ncbi:MAG: division plane positioning ATPase MipZ, partial [Pseudomonadota bacterium]
MTSPAHVIVLGNEKGGSGKSTTAMHIFVALAREGQVVGAMDLDTRQKSFFRYLENRAAFNRKREDQGLQPLVMPIQRQVDASDH